MIKYSAKIEIIPNENKVDKIETSATSNNLSNLRDFSNSNGINISMDSLWHGNYDLPFILSDDEEENGSKLDIGDVLTEENGYKGYMSNGFATGTLKLTIYTKSDCLIIYFDRYRKQFPKKIKIGGYIFDNDNDIFVINLNNINVSNIIEIEMYDWNIKTFPYMVCDVSSGIVLNFDFGKIKSFSLNNSDHNLGDIKYINGIAQSNGRLSLIDYDETLKELSEQKILSTNNKISFFIKYKKHGIEQEEQIKSMYSESWEYDQSSHVASVSLSDNIVLLQDYYIERDYIIKNFNILDYDEYPDLESNPTLLNVLEYYLGLCGFILDINDLTNYDYYGNLRYNLLNDYKLLTKTTDDYVVQDFTIKEGTSVWNLFSSFLQITMCSCYVKKDNILKVIYNGY